MHFTVVIDMKNPNALIAMAQVAQNANNPYAAFCEYIKYCVFSTASSVVTLSEIRTAVGKEFGLYMPHNVLVKCLTYIRTEGVITFDTHQIKRVGSFDTEAFDQNRETYRTTESAIIQSLMQYASKYNRKWTVERARELLIKTLDRNGLAYDIFLHEGDTKQENHLHTISESELTEMLPDDEEAESNDIEGQPLFTDEYFVGKFIEETLAGDTAQKDYLKKICEGLMTKCQENFNACANAPGQYAATVALDHPELCEELRQTFERRRSILLDGLAKIDGIRCNRPNGAFYVFADISSFGLSSVEFCNRLLDEQKVVCIPGSAFGECGEGFIRIAYTCSDDNLYEALNRISCFCKKLMK